MGQGKRRIRYMADTGDGRGYTRHSETVYGTRKQADEVLAQRRIEHSQDKPVPTLKQAYEAWYLPEMLGQLKENEFSQNSYKSYVSRWKIHIEPVWGDQPVTAIKPLGIQEWLLSMTQGIAVTSLMVLRKILDKCVIRTFTHCVNFARSWKLSVALLPIFRLCFAVLGRAELENLLV